MKSDYRAKQQYQQAQTLTAQESMVSNSGFAGLARDRLDDRTPTVTPSGSLIGGGGHKFEQQSSIQIDLMQHNNNNVSADNTQLDGDFFKQSPSQSINNHAIEIMSLDSATGSPSSPSKSTVQRQIQISVYKDQSLDSINDRAPSDDLLKPQKVGGLVGQIQRSKRTLGGKPQINYTQDEIENDVAPSTTKTDVPINVIARVRPIIPNEMRHPVCIEVVDDSVVNGSKTQIMVRQAISKQSDGKIYSFEKVLDPESSQSNVFQGVDGSNLCNAFLNGQNCTIFVYGPTSTGKTFTMQGNAEDIIHGNTNGNRSNIPSRQGSPDVSQNASMIVDDSMNNTIDPNFTPTKSRKLNSTANRRFQSTNYGRRESSSFYQKRTPEMSPNSQYRNNGRPCIAKAARDMMSESRDKGIIQRVLDQIYDQFDRREDLAKNCEIKISFLEIYKEQVTDILEGHVQVKTAAEKKANHQQLSSSFAIHPVEKDKQPKSPHRGKAQTFYAGNLEETIQQRRSAMEIDNQSSPQSGAHRGDKSQQRQKANTQRDLLINMKQDKKKYTVQENKIKGVYVQNLSEVTCVSVEQAYNCFLDGLMRKRMSQTVRNTSSSRSHTIFQIKMYMKAENQNQLLLPQYKLGLENETKLVAKFSLIDLAGSEKTAGETNQERIAEACSINQSLSALGNVVGALRTQALKANQGSQNLDQSMVSRSGGGGGGGGGRRSSFHSGIKSPPAFKDMNHANTMPRRMSVFESKPQHIPYRDSKLTHILKDCLGSNSFTHLIICLSPSYLCISESISTLAFTKNAKAVKNKVVENVQFKSDMIQRNLSALNAAQPGMSSVRSQKPTNNQILSQFANANSPAGGAQQQSEEDIKMLNEIWQEYGGTSQDEMSIIQLFKLTLEQMKKISNKNEDQSKVIQEMKSAMEKDLNNPKTLEIITQARSERQYSEVNRGNSFHSIDAIGGQLTPRQEQSQLSLFTQNQDPLMQNYKTAQPMTGKQTVRNNTLKSISEEDHSASMASPKDQIESSKPSMFGNSGYQPRRSSNNAPRHAKHASTTSIMTFAGENQFLSYGRQNGPLPKSRPSDINVFGKMHGSFPGKVENQNSCETGGGRVSSRQQEDESSQQMDTEPAENLDEATPCGCSHSLYGQQRQSVIPQSFIAQMHRPQVINTLRTLIQKHLKNFIRRKLIMEGFNHQQKLKLNATKTSLLNMHKRQKSHDTRSRRVILGNEKTAKAQDLTNNGSLSKLIEPQMCIRKSIDIDQEQKDKLQQSLYSARHILRESSDQLQVSNGHFTEIEKAGMQYFMPKLLKSSSCPSYPDRQAPMSDVEQCQEVKQKVKQKQEDSVDNNGSQELEVSDICSSYSDSYQGGRLVQRDDYESSPGQNRNTRSGPESSHINFNPPQVEQIGSLRNMLKQEPTNSQSPGKSSSNFQRFESSQVGGGYFESSRFSGSNSQQNMSLIQSQSQKFLAPNKNRVVNHIDGKNRIVQLRQENKPQSSQQVSVWKSNQRAQESRASMRSNEIVVVEEVADHELSSEAFIRIRQSKGTFNSMHTDSLSNSKNMGPLLEDCKLPQHIGSHLEPSKIHENEKQPTTISSIQNDANESQQSSVKAYFNKSSGTNSKAARTMGKFLISDLNKSHGKTFGKVMGPPAQRIKPSKDQQHQLQSGTYASKTIQKYSVPTKVPPSMGVMTHSSAVSARKPNTSYNNNGYQSYKQSQVAKQGGVIMPQQPIVGASGKSKSKYEAYDSNSRFTNTIQLPSSQKSKSSVMGMPQFNTPGPKTMTKNMSAYSMSIQSKNASSSATRSPGRYNNKFAQGQPNLHSLLKPNKPEASTIKLSKPMIGVGKGDDGS